MFSSRTEFASRCRVASRAAVEVGAVATDVMTDATIDVTIAEMTEGRTETAIAAGRGRDSNSHFVILACHSPVLDGLD